MQNQDSLAVRVRSPFRGLLDSFFADSLPEAFPGPLAPATNIAESADQLAIEFELPGVEESDIQLEVHERQLVVHAERKDTRAQAKDTNWHRVEHRFGTWSRTIVLPDSVDGAAATAKYRNGVLSVTIPKHPKSKPVRLQIKQS